MSFKLVISDPETANSFQIDLTGAKANRLIGKRIGETLEGDLIGFPGYEFSIRGGSDKAGFPMHRSFHGGARKRILLKGPIGFHPTRPGQRKRKSVRGNMISEDIAQINLKTIKKGEKPLEELIGKV